MIEPGHFRFSVVGETVLRLKARLWFVHRGLEKLFEGAPAGGAVELAERVSGDTSVAHALAHCLAGRRRPGHRGADQPPAAGPVVELNARTTMSTDLGALANDVGFALAHVYTQPYANNCCGPNAGVTVYLSLRGAVLRARSRCGDCRT